MSGAADPTEIPIGPSPARTLTRDDLRWCVLMALVLLGLVVTAPVVAVEWVARRWWWWV